MLRVSPAVMANDLNSQCKDGHHILEQGIEDQVKQVLQYCPLCELQIHSTWEQSRIQQEGSSSEHMMGEHLARMLDKT
jgi:hypothetical protein